MKYPNPKVTEPIPQCKITPLQLNVFHSKSNFSKIIKISSAINQKYKVFTV